MSLSLSIRRHYFFLRLLWLRELFWATDISITSDDVEDVWLELVDGLEVLVPEESCDSLWTPGLVEICEDDWDALMMPESGSASLSVLLSSRVPTVVRLLVFAGSSVAPGSSTSSSNTNTRPSSVNSTVLRVEVLGICWISSATSYANKYKKYSVNLVISRPINVWCLPVIPDVFFFWQS